MGVVVEVVIVQVLMARLLLSYQALEVVDGEQVEVVHMDILEVLEGKPWQKMDIL